jgi:hypothetical protein
METYVIVRRNGWRSSPVHLRPDGLFTEFPKAR